MLVAYCWIKFKSLREPLYWLIPLGRRRRRKLIRVYRKRIPKIFVCPLCGKRAITVRMRRSIGVAYVTCGVCGASGEVRIPKGMSPVDAYCEWYDKAASARSVETPVELKG